MIRPARLSDLHQIRFLAQTCFAPYMVRMGSRPEPMNEDFRTLVEAGQIYNFMIENAVRGFICYHVDGPDVHVQAIAVAARYRGRGIGRSLIDKADRDGLRHGCRRVILYTNVLMFENISYYKSKGFQEIDRRQQNGYDRVYFERYLR